MSDKPIVFMLSTPKNVRKNTTRSSLSQWRKNFRAFPFQGVVRSTEKSKIVMDGWKKFFNQIKTNRDIIISEDDVLWDDSWDQVKKKIKKDKINWLCYQKMFKEKQKDGSTKMIPVGAQALYIPNSLIPYMKEELNKSKSIHFDRWLSRLDKIHYAYKPHEVCAEIESASVTTGKVRKGKKIQEIPLPKSRGGFQVLKFANIPVLKEPKTPLIQ